MEKSMIPSKRKSMTDGQANKGGDIFRALLRKHRQEFPSEPAQEALGAESLAADLLAVWRKHVEMFSNMIIRIVSVNRDRSPQGALGATGRKQYTDNGVVNAMPNGEGEKAKVVFFKPDPSAYDENGLISDDNLEKEFESRGFKPVDPYSLAKVNEDDPSFTDSHPNGTHWKDSSGKWCYAAFYRYGVGRYVYVYRLGGDWGSLWWFAGVRK